ncbi:MAG TPA: hypothetical protein VMW74_08685 [Nitrosopumilaceae archaeon]|nr:hypothetical protein [Nitrosopumilaceae archaeon]
MDLFNKVKKGTTNPLKKNVDGKIGAEQVGKEVKEEIHYMKGDLKDLGKQLKTKDSIVVKNNAFVILHSGPKNQISFLSEFEKLTKEGYMLTGITETKGIPLTLFGFNIKTGKLFFFQHTKWFS